MNSSICLAVFVAIFAITCAGCREYRGDLDYDYSVEQVTSVEGLNFGEITQFESVPWQPDVSASIRRLILDDAIADGRDVLEIETGTGVIAILCVQNGAKQVVATDTRPAAVANAKYNAARLESDAGLDVRLADGGSRCGFDKLRADETFDLIIYTAVGVDFGSASTTVDAIFDRMESLLNRGGRCLITLCHPTLVERLIEQGANRQMQIKVLDDRELSALETPCVPGILIEFRPPLTRD